MVVLEDMVQNGGGQVRATRDLIARADEIGVSPSLEEQQGRLNVGSVALGQQRSLARVLVDRSHGKLGRGNCL